MACLGRFAQLGWQGVASERTSGKQRTIGGAFDVAGANRAIDLLRDESLYGSLTITDGLQDLCAFFTRGGLRLLASGRPLPTLRERLVAQGQLEAEAARSIDLALEEGKAQGSRLRDERELLLNAHGFKPGDLDAISAEVVLEILMGCLLWEHADFELRTGEPDREVMTRRDLPALTLSVGVDKLLERFKSRLRVVKDVRHTVPSARATVEPSPAGRERIAQNQPVGPPGPAQATERRELTRLLRRIVEEPGSSVRHLALRLLTGEVDLAAQLQPLIKEGLVKIAFARADQRAELERLRQMEEALDQALNQLMRRVAVARSAAGQGETKRAARHMARAGGLLLQAGRNDEAARTFEEALGHADEDLEAREGFVQSLWATGREDEAARQSDELGRRYLDLNLPGRARRVLERALGFREETSTLELLVDSLVKLDRSGPAAEAGERLINRLRREGKLDEARALADKLMSTGDEKTRERLARAAGVDRIKIAIAVAFGLFSLGGTYALGQVNGARDEFRTAAAGVREALGGAASIEQIERGLQTGLDALRPLAAREDQIGAHAAQVVLNLEATQKDCHLQRRLAALLPWKSHHDVDELRGRVGEIAREVRSSALGAPVADLRRELDGFVERFDERRNQLLALAERKPSGAELEEVYALVKATRLEFGSLPQRLGQVYLPVRIETVPEGADVSVDGSRYESKTPLYVNLGLRGALVVELEMEGFESVRAELHLDGLEGPVFRRELVPELDESRKTEGKLAVLLLPGQTRGRLSRRYSRLSLSKDSRYFWRLDLDSQFRGRVQAVSEIKADRVFLTGLRVTLWKWVDGAWKSTRTIDLEVDSIERPTRALGQVLHVEPLSETKGLDHEALSRRVQTALRELANEAGGR